MSTIRLDRPDVRLPIAAAVLLAVAVCFQGGCGQPDQDLPATYEVKGTLVSADGQPIGGGMIEFRSKAGASLSAVGRTQPDGTFSLTTMVNNRKVPGAVAGPHQVTVMPPPPDTQDVQAVAEPVVLPDTFEVKPDGSNEFTIKLRPVR